MALSLSLLVNDIFFGTRIFFFQRRRTFVCHQTTVVVVAKCWSRQSEDVFDCCTHYNVTTGRLVEVATSFRYQRSVEVVLRAYQVPLSTQRASNCGPIAGLSSAEASRRRDLCGPNTLPEPVPAEGGVRWCCSPMKDKELLDVYQYTARTRKTPMVVVLRGGLWCVLSSHDLVPGDVVALRAGDAVPADVRVLACSYGFDVNRCMVTGESLPQRLSVDNKHSALHPLEATNIALLQTHITSGYGVGLVLFTGSQTVMGTIASLTWNVWEEEEKHVSRSVLREVVISLARDDGVVLQDYPAPSLITFAHSEVLVAELDNLPSPEMLRFLLHTYTFTALMVPYDVLQAFLFSPSHHAVQCREVCYPLRPNVQYMSFEDATAAVRADHEQASALVTAAGLAREGVALRGAIAVGWASGQRFLRVCSEFQPERPPGSKDDDRDKGNLEYVTYFTPANPKRFGPFFDSLQLTSSVVSGAEASDTALALATATVYTEPGQPAAQTLEWLPGYKRRARAVAASHRGPCVVQ